MAKKRRSDAEGADEPRKEADDDKPKSKSPLLLVGIIGGVLLLCCTCSGVGTAGWFLRDKLGLGGAVAKKDGDDKKDTLAADGPKQDGKPDDKLPKGEVRKPDFATTAEEFFREFDIKDNSAAQVKYAGKVIELTGEVQKVRDKNMFFLFGVKMLTKSGKVIPSPGHNIGCAVLPDYHEKAIALAVGQKVKVVGKFKQAQLFSVHLTDCSVVELEKGNVPLVSLDEITAEYEKGVAAAKAKYDRMDMIVTGTIDRVERAPDDSGLLTMKCTSTKTRVFVLVVRVGQLRAGQRIEFRANMLITSYRNNELHITMSSLVKAS